MVRMTIAAVVVAAAGSGASAQWATVPGSPNDVYNTNSGLVGVNCYPFRGKFHAIASSGTNAICGETTQTTGNGVLGLVNSSSNTAAAVFGWSLATGGLGVYGLSAATTGGGIGVWGQTSSAGGIGLVGRADHASGGTAVFAGVTASGAYGIYSVGGKNYLDGNTGIGTNAPTAKLHVDGTVRFSGVNAMTTGTANVVAMDSTGKLMQQPPSMGSGSKEFRGAGTTTWTLPNGVTRVRVKMWGGGGGGNTDASIVNYGGGSGAYVEGVLSLPAGTTLTLTVGGGGAMNTAGGNTVISNGFTVLLRAGGGGGASNAGAGSPGTVGMAFVDSSLGSDFIAHDGSTLSVYNSTFVPPPYPGPFEVPTPASGTSTTFVSAGSGGAKSWSGVAGAITIQW